MTTPIANHGSISAFARALGMPIPRVWRRIKSLERQGVPITRRTVLDANIANRRRQCARILDEWQVREGIAP
jgi:molybdenum-dependent DNA-binding transcriptional regulator ModE